MSVLTDTARGALLAQDLLRRMDRGKAAPGELLARMRASLDEGPTFADAFAREIEKALQRRTVGESHAG